MDCYFVTGTDTEVGKTVTTAVILKALAEEGIRTLGLKPVAAGCEQTPQGWINEDAMLLQRYSSEQLNLNAVNPFALQLPMAPHLAAEEANVTLNVDTLVKHCKQFYTRADKILIEGAGGWLVPLNERQTFADFAKAMDIPVILVVGMRLGCINHALLTARQILADGLKLAGWVANEVKPFTAISGSKLNAEDYLKANIQSICEQFDAHAIHCPLLGNLPYSKPLVIEEMTANIHLSQLAF